MSNLKFAAAALAMGAIGAAVTELRADDRWLNDSEILDVFHDRTIEGSYASGRSFTESYRANGSVEYSERGVSMGGYWSVTSGTLCTIYELDPAGGCFRVARVGENCFEFYFAARTEKAAPGPDEEKPAWTARGSIRGKSTACPEGADV
ncbi:MAG: hypothetical protein ACKVP4_13570 [Hyphomicrobium sp.]